MKKELTDNEVKKSVKKITGHLDKSLRYLHKAAEESNEVWREVCKLEEGGYPHTNTEKKKWNEFKTQLSFYDSDILRNTIAFKNSVYFTQSR